MSADECGCGDRTAVMHADYQHAFAWIYECVRCGKRVTIVQARKGHTLSPEDEESIRLHAEAILALTGDTETRTP